MITVSIIGFSGRSEKEISGDVYYKSLEIAKKYIERFGQSSDIVLVAGGGAWCDHIAIDLYLSGDYKGLVIHGPCRWTGLEYDDNGAFDWRVNPGKTANHYHRTFSKATNKNSLSDIQNAIRKGAVYIEHEYYHSRFSSISETDYLLCFTWSRNTRPEKGAHLDIWKKAKCKKIHVSLCFTDRNNLLTLP